VDLIIVEAFPGCQFWITLQFGRTVFEALMILLGISNRIWSVDDSAWYIEPYLKRRWFCLVHRTLFEELMILPNTLEIPLVRSAKFWSSQVYPTRSNGNGNFCLQYTLWGIAVALGDFNETWTPSVSGHVSALRISRKKVLGQTVSVGHWRGVKREIYWRGSYEVKEK